MWENLMRLTAIIYYDSLSLSAFLVCFIIKKKSWPGTCVGMPLGALEAEVRGSQVQGLSGNQDPVSNKILKRARDTAQR